MNEEQEFLLTDLPLNPLPTNFIQNVMARVAQTAQFSPPPYRIQFLDVALALFITLLASMSFGLSWWFSGNTFEGLPTFQIELPYLSSLSWIAWVLMAQILLCVLIGVGLWMNNTFDELLDN